MKLIVFKLANIFFSKGFMLVPDLARDETGGTGTSTSANWVSSIVDVLRSIVSPALIIMSAVGAIYAIVLGVKMAQADDQSKRDEAKKNLINVIIAVVATILLIVLFYMLGEWIGTDNFPV